MRLMLWSGQSTMVHPSSRTFAVMEDMSTSRSWWTRDPSTYMTVVVQPLAGGGSGVPWASTKISPADGRGHAPQILHPRGVLK